MNKRCQKIKLVTLFLLLNWSLYAYSDDRQFIMIIDNSGSMEKNDPARYSVQAAKIISDLLETQDEYSVIKLPRGKEKCNQRSNLTLVFSDQASIRSLDSLVEITNNTPFSAPIRTAFDLFNNSQHTDKTLLIISDVGSEKLFKCIDTKNYFKKFKAAGIRLAAINIGEGDLAKNNSYFGYSTFVKDSRGLIEAVAAVYQRFLGRKQLFTGSVNDKLVSVNIDRYVRNAYLVVAADGIVGNVRLESINPVAESINENYKGGGTTIGWGKDQNKRRSYRIVRLIHPESGSWNFNFPQINSKAGWILIQDFSIGMRLKSTPTIKQGVPSKVEIELFDEKTGKSVPIDSDMSLKLTRDGQVYVFENQGNIFHTSLTLNEPEQLDFTANLQNRNIDKKQIISLDVVPNLWMIHPDVPRLVEINKQIQLKAKVKTEDLINYKNKPSVIYVSMNDGTKLEMLPSITENFETTEYVANWIPEQIGEVSMTFYSKENEKIEHVSAVTKVVGVSSFGPSTPVNFGKTESYSEVERELDFSSAKVYSELKVQLKSNIDLGGSKLVLLDQNLWKVIEDDIELTLIEGKSNKWPLKLIVERCPQSVVPSKTFAISAAFIRANGERVSTDIPISMEIEELPWLTCWWPLLALASIIALAIKIIHCIRSPARFPPEFGLLLSADENINEEGIFYRVVDSPGTKSGFCRNAQIYLHEDFRFSKNPKGAILLLLAKSDGVYLVTVGGGTLFRKTVGREWEEISIEDESYLRTGVVYRNQFKTLYFEARLVAN